MQIGFGIAEQAARPDPELLELLRGVPASNIGDVMHRLYCMEGGMRPFNLHPLLGPAFTVKLPEGDNLMLHRALDLAKPGDILVVSAGSASTRAVMGEIMVTYAWRRGLGGVVVDGYLRDEQGLGRAGIPVYGRGINPQGPYKNGPGEIGTPVACGGQVVSPGDIIAGDADGVVVIPRHCAGQVARAAREKMAQEDESLGRMRRGEDDGGAHRRQYEALLGKLLGE